MKKFTKVIALILSLTLLLCFPIGVSAAEAEDTGADTAVKGSLTIYKVDLTNAKKDGAWDSSYVSTGVYDQNVNDTLNSYISSENGSDYLPKIITSTVKGIVNDSDNRIGRILFKLAVEQAITMNVVAAACNIGREQLEKLRGTCVAQVKRSNGVYSFEDAFDFQKR